MHSFAFGIQTDNISEKLGWQLAFPCGNSPNEPAPRIPPSQPMNIDENARPSPCYVEYSMDVAWSPNFIAHDVFAAVTALIAAKNLSKYWHLPSSSPPDATNISNFQNLASHERNGVNPRIAWRRYPGIIRHSTPCSPVVSAPSERQMEWCAGGLGRPLTPLRGARTSPAHSPRPDPAAAEKYRRH